jgi:hypothetical protein
MCQRHEALATHARTCTVSKRPRMEGSRCRYPWCVCTLYVLSDRGSCPPAPRTLKMSLPPQPAAASRRRGCQRTRWPRPHIHQRRPTPGRRNLGRPPARRPILWCTGHCLAPASPEARRLRVSCSRQERQGAALLWGIKGVDRYCSTTGSWDMPPRPVERPGAPAGERQETNRSTPSTMNPSCQLFVDLGCAQAWEP